jgi:hypothetical protein
VAEVAAAAAILGRQCRAKKPFAPGLEPGFAVDDAVGQPLFLARHAFALEEAAHGGAELLMIFTIDTTNDFHDVSSLSGIGVAGRSNDPAGSR